MKQNDVPKINVCEPLCDDEGATLLEFVFVLPILLILILAIMDFSRFMLIQALLTKGAENGLNTALKIPNLETDIRGLASSNIDYQMYREARRRVLFEATRLPLTTLLTAPGTDSSAVLLEYSVTDPNVGGGPVPVAKGALFLHKSCQGAAVTHR